MKNNSRIATAIIIIFAVILVVFCAIYNFAPSLFNSKVQDLQGSIRGCTYSRCKFNKSLYCSNGCIPLLFVIQ